MALPQFSVSDTASAGAFARWSVDGIGVGYHPDSPFSEYIDGTGQQLFTADECAALDSLTERAFLVCEDTFYDIAAERQRQCLGPV